MPGMLTLALRNVPLAIEAQGVGNDATADFRPSNQSALSCQRVCSRRVYMATSRPTFGAFNQGANAHHRVLQQGDRPARRRLRRLDRGHAGVRGQVRGPGVGHAGQAGQVDRVLKGAWAMVFLDDADSPGALAYHDLTPDGLPESKVFVKTTLREQGAGERVGLPRAGGDAGGPGHQSADHGARSEDHLRVRKRGPGRGAQLSRSTGSR